MANLGVALLLSILVARVAGAAVRGEFAALQAVAMVLSWVGAAGSDRSLPVLSRAAGTGVVQILASQRVSYMVLGFSASAAAVTYSFLVLQWPPGVVAALVVTVLIGMAWQVGIGVVLAVDRSTTRFENLKLLQPASLMIFGFIAIWVVPPRHHFEGLVGALLFSYAFSFGVLVFTREELRRGRWRVILKRVEEHRHSGKNMPEECRKEWRATALATNLELASRRIDLIVLPLFAPASVVGKWAVVASVARAAYALGAAGFIRRLASGATAGRPLATVPWAVVLGAVVASTVNIVVATLYGSSFTVSVLTALLLGVFTGLGVLAQHATATELLAGRATSLTLSQGLCVGATAFVVGVAASVEGSAAAVAFGQAVLFAGILAGRCRAEIGSSGGRTQASE